MNRVSRRAVPAYACRCLASGGAALPVLLDTSHHPKPCGGHGLLRNRLLKSTLSLALLAASSAALAEPETVLPTFVFTATRTEQSADESLASVTVITREDIEKKQLLSVQGALLGVPGLGLSNNGGLGKPSDVFLRGTNSDHVLVLVDGVRMGSATLGTTAFQDLPIDQVERIEIVRGPRSSLYGSEAIGGVIQIFTRKGGDGLKPFLSLGGGTYDTYKVSAGLSGGDEKAWFNFSGAALYTGGINACLGRPFELGGGGCYTYEPDHDGYSNVSGSARAGYRFDNGVEIEGNLLQASGDNHYDGSFVNRSEVMQQVIGGKLRFAPAAFWNTTLRAGTSADMSNNYLGKVFNNRFDTRRITASWQNDFTLAKDHLLTAGFDYYDDEIDSTEAFPVTSRDDKAGFLQYQGLVYGHSLDLAVRQDSNQQFGGKTTGSAAWGYSFDEALRLSASYGTAFKAPTFNDLYYPYFGNPNLQPESSQSVEVGAKGRWERLSWSVNGYYTKIDDLIAFDSHTFQPANISKAEIYGLEAITSARLFGTDINANLSLLDPRNQEDGPNHGNLLPRRAQQMAQLDLDRRFGKFRIGLTVNQEGRRYDDLANTVRLRAFTTVGLRASYEVYKDVFLEGRAYNLFNEHYQTAFLYNQMGTNLFLSLNWRPGGTP
jgi:vitamin B12 transporter